MQKRVLFIALVAFSGGAVTTMMAASYLATPSAPEQKPATIDLSRVQTVAPTPDEPACAPRTWPYFGPDCSKKPSRGAEAKLLSAVAFVTPANLALDVGQLASPVAALQPLTKVDTVAAVSPAAAVGPAPLAKAVEPLRAPQATEPMRTVEFERSTDAAARQVRLIRIDRGPPDDADATGSTSAKAPVAQASAAAAPPAATAVAQASAPKVETTPALAAASAAPKTEQVAAQPPATDAKGRPASPASSATALPAAPPPPAAAQQEKSFDRSATRSRRRVAREEDEIDARARRRDERYSRRERYDERPAQDLQVRGVERRGRYALEEAPSARGGRRPSGGDRDVFGWLGSSN